MNQQQYSDMKYLTSQKQWQTTYKQLLNEEIASLKDTIVACKDEDLCFLKDRILAVTMVLNFVEQQIEQYEEAKEKTT